MKFLALTLMMFSFSAFSQVDGCRRYQSNPVFMKSIETVASHMEYSFEELCSHPRVMDIHVTNTTVDNEGHEPIPHVWVTLHYNEYSCQYFVRESDFIVTKSNCYNTW